MVNYTKLAADYLRHHERFRRYVKSMACRLTCQECGGSGGWTEIINWEIGGPWYECDWCEGTGLMTPWRRGFWLRARTAAAEAGRSAGKRRSTDDNF